MNATPDFRTRPRVAASPLPARLALAAAAAALLLALGSGVRATLARDQARARAELAQQAVVPVRAQLRARERLARRDGTWRHQAELTTAAAPPRVIAVLAALVPADARVERLDLRYGDQLDLDLHVETRTPAAYDRFLEALAASGRVENIVPGAEVREGEVAASVKAVYRPWARP